MPGDAWNAPECLVEDSADGGFKVNNEVLERLKKTTTPFVAVVICGPFGSGKSYLLNRIAGKHQAFQVGMHHGPQRKAGIHCLLQPHPNNPGVNLMFLDTQGTGSLTVGNQDQSILREALVATLASILVYNLQNTISQDNVEMLHRILKTAESMQHGKSVMEHHLVAVIRNMTLELSRKGQKITEDEFLEGMLSPTTEEDPSGLSSGSESQRYVRDYFHSRKCFCMPPPTVTSALRQMEVSRDIVLDEEFQQQMELLKEYVLRMEVADGLTGTELADILLNNVDSIDAGEIKPYRIPAREMPEWKQPAGGTIPGQADGRRGVRQDRPVRTVEDWEKVDSIQRFNMDAEKYNREVMPRIKREVEEEMEARTKDTRRYKALLDELGTQVAQRNKDGYYIKNMDYQAFINDLQDVETQYLSKVGENDEQAKEALQNFKHNYSTSLTVVRQTIEKLKPKENPSGNPQPPLEIPQPPPEIPQPPPEIPQPSPCSQEGGGGEKTEKVEKDNRLKNKGDEISDKKDENEGGDGKTGCFGKRERKEDNKIEDSQGLVETRNERTKVKPQKGDEDGKTGCFGKKKEKEDKKDSQDFVASKTQNETGKEVDGNELDTSSCSYHIVTDNSPDVNPSCWRLCICKC